MATYLPSRELSKQDEQNMLGTAGKVDELISDVLLWTPTHGHTSVDQPGKTYIV